MADAPQVRVERDGPVTTVTFDNPPHQLMTGRMVAELGGAVEELERDLATRAVVLTGAHPERFIAHFSVEELLAGAETGGPQLSSRQASAALHVAGALARVPGGAGALARSPARGLLELVAFHEVMLRLGRLDKVVIAALNGSAMGGGFELAQACDLRYMADGDFVLGQPEVLLGIIPGGGGTQRLARLLGPGRALELILEGTPLSPREALDLGLVNRVVEPGRLLEEARETAVRLARRPPAAVREAKRAVYQGGSMPLEDGLHVERSAFMATLGDPDAIRLMRAYADSTRERGELPGYDAGLRERLLDGTFGS